MEVTEAGVAVGIKCPKCGRDAKASPPSIPFPHSFKIARAIVCDHGTGRPQKLAEVYGYPNALAEVVQRVINEEYEESGGRTWIKVHA